jgi:hypothetical protein
MHQAQIDARTRAADAFTHCDHCDSERRRRLRCEGGSRQSLFQRFLAAFTGLAVAVAVTIAVDYGIGPVQAASLEAAPVQALSSPVATAGTQLIFHPIPSAIGPDPGVGLVRLPGHVIDALAAAAPVNPLLTPFAAVPDPDMALTVVLKRDHPAEFDRYMRDAYDSQSKHFRHFLTPQQIASRFGPSPQTYKRVLGYLQGQGLKVAQRSKNRMTVTVHGTRAKVEKAFALDIVDYKIGDAKFYANTADPALPVSLAAHVTSISGLSSFAVPQHANLGLVFCGALASLSGFMFATYAAGTAGAAAAGAIGGVALAPVLVGLATVGLIAGVICTVVATYQYVTSQGFKQDLKKVYYFGLGKGSSATRGRAANKAAATDASAPPDGSGQVIGLLEFDSFNRSDVGDYLTLIGAPPSQLENLTEVPVNGGTTPGENQSEVLIDIDEVMNVAPGAKVVVYDAPFSGQASNYAQLFNAMINGGVTVISNSWASCEDQVSLAEAQGIDTVLQSAAASGISVFNGTGDHGSTCLDGAANTISVPADSPNATAVGGTSFTGGQDFTYGSETWWDGSASTPASGQGGFGTSKYFTRPAYQNGVNTSSSRSVPDVAFNADPANGIAICQASAGGCPTGLFYGGTSLAAPTWAAFTALLNQIRGQNLGAVNPLFYPLATTPAFHNAASMGSDFAHVGLGSPNLNVLNRLLNGGVVGAPSATLSELLAIGPASVEFGSAAGVPADGSTTGGVRVTLLDANGNIVSGKTITLTAAGGSARITPASAVTTVSNGAAIFSVTDLTPEAITFTATDTTDGITLPQTAQVTFAAPPASAAGITANPSTVAADGTSAATITVTLKDALNRPSPGKTVAVSDGGAHAVMTGPTPGVTDANGQIQFSATDQVNETVTFTAVDVTDSNLAIPGSGTVTYSGSTNSACGVGVVPVAGTGYTITPYITGLPASALLFYGNSNLHCPGGNTPAFTSGGTVLVSDFLSGGIYQTALAGGAVSSANLLSTLTPALGGLVYGKDGNVYATLGGEGGEIIQVNPTTGAMVRVVASGLTCPGGLAVDPLSGDLFFDDECYGGGSDDPSVFRVIDPANTDPSRPTSVVVYATLATTPNGGMAFAPNGTLFAVSGYYVSDTAQVEQISATNSPTVAVTPLTGITSDFAVAIGATNSDGSAQSLIVEPAGVLSEIPIVTPGAAVVLATGSPGVGVTGPDGCQYSAHYDTIYRLASSSGSCTFAPTSPAPSIKLTPASVSPNPAQGGQGTFTATVKNLSTLSGIPVFFQIGGANAQIKLVDTDAKGTAVLNYTASQAGADTIVASTTANGTALTSNRAQVTWANGKHVTFLSLNLSPQGGMVNHAVNVVASLTDASATPEAPLSGHSITFTLNGASCTATTNSTGVATCSLTPSMPGTSTLTASFTGSSTFVAATQSIGFNVSAGPTAAPTVTLSVSPATIAAGASATLTWSSTNATACTASGSWSGSEATAGTQRVTPTANGSYSYKLSCSGAGGTGTAAAVLSATLVAVTVTAKSGGGALGWYAVLALALLVMLRLTAAMRGSVLPGAMRTRGDSTLRGVSMLAFALACAAPHSARADQSLTTDQAATATDPYYVGIRVGSMVLRQDSSKIDQGLASAGFGDVTATTDNSGVAGTLFLGYEFTAHTALELSYTFRDSTTAHLSGTIPSTSKLTPLLLETAELTRGYGNIIALSYSGRFEVLPRFSLEPRLGGFFWASKASAAALDDRVDTTHEGGGVTAGLTAAYRLWRGLELGLSVDHYRGFPSNIATLYAGSLEWRFGR